MLLISVHDGGKVHASTFIRRFMHDLVLSYFLTKLLVCSLLMHRFNACVVHFCIISRYLFFEVVTPKYLVTDFDKKITGLPSLNY